MFYYYGIDGFPDHGWGCVYRNIQSVISFIKDEIPTIPNMLEFFNKDISVESKRELWITPKDAKDFLEFYLENYLLKYDYYELNSDEFNILVEKVKLSEIPTIIDDGVFSYILFYNDNKLYLADPHIIKNNVRCINPDWLYNKDRLMCLTIFR